MSNIRVLVLSSMYPRNIDPVYGSFVHNQIKHLIKAGCHIRVISPVPYAPRILWARPKWRQLRQIPKYDVIDGIRIYYPRYGHIPGKWFYGISCLNMYYGIRESVELIIKEFRPQIIHSYTATPCGYVGLMLKKKFNIPLICSLRGSDVNVLPNYNRFNFHLTKRVILEADQITTVSNALKIIAETIAKPATEIRTVYNGCDTDTFSRDDRMGLQIREKIGVSSKVNVVIFVGNILKEKGVLELINAFTQLNLMHPNLNLVFVGNGPESDMLKKIIGSHELSNKVHLVGRKIPSEIPWWLSAADIFALPTYHEGSPNAVREAMACGLPVVATRVGGIPEVVEDGESGILVDKKDVTSLVDAISALINSPDMRKKMGKRGREIIEDNFTWDKSSKDLREIYEKVLL